VIRPISALLYCCLSVTVVFAFAKLSPTLGLQYHVGYEFSRVSLVFFSKDTDSLIWLVGNVAVASMAFILELADSDKSRWAYALFSVSMVPPIGFYLNQQRLAAYWISFIAQVFFIAFSATFAQRFRLGLRFDGFLTALGIVVMFMVVELFSLVRNLERVGKPSLRLIDLQPQLSGLAFTISARLMLVALFSWVVIIPLLFRTLRRGAIQEAAKPPERNTRLVSVLLLLMAIVISVLVVLSPYGSSSMLRGVDTRVYYEQLSSFRNPTDPLTLFGVDYKAFVLFLFYAIEFFTRWNPHLVIIAAPAALAVLLVTVSFLFALGITGNWLAAGFSGILGAVSFQVAVGLYAGIFANFLAISFMILVLYFLSTPLNKIRAFLMVVASYAVLLAHVWTWVILMAAVGASAIFNALLWLVIRKNQALKSSILAHSLVLFCGVLPIIAAYRGFGLRLLPPTIASSTASVLGAMSLRAAGIVISSLSVTLTRYVGAIFAYPLTLTLVILGFILLAGMNMRAVGPLVGLFAATSLLTLLLGSEYQWRLLYLIPFQALAAVGLLALLRGLEWGAERFKIDPTTRLFRLFEGLLIGVILIDAVNYALIATASLPIS
jgi:hypothetical protein